MKNILNTIFSPEIQKISTFAKLERLLALFSLYLIYVITYLSFYKTISNPLETATVCNLNTPLQSLFHSCVIAPIWEETVFRIFPILLLKETKMIEKMIVPTIFFSSFIFGFLHGGGFNIFFQGVFGICCCILFLKTNYSTTSILIFHALWNFILETKLIVFVL